MLIVPRAVDLGEMEVRRALPSVKRQMVGPFIFFDQMSPAKFPPTPELLGVGMRRRDFIAALGAVAAWPCSAASWASRFDLGQETHQAEQAVSWLRSGSGPP